MTSNLIRRTVLSILLMGFGAVSVLGLQGLRAEAKVKDDGILKGLDGCLAPRQKLHLPGSKPIEVEVVALQLVGLDPGSDMTFPITVLPEGAVIPSAPPPTTKLAVAPDSFFDVFFDVSLTDLAGVDAIALCNCLGNLCRGLDCRDGAGLCTKRADCL